MVINGDNRASELEWNTRSENQSHAYKTGLQKASERQRKHAKKLCIEMNKQKSKAVNQYDLAGNFIKAWKNMHDIERELKIDNSSISRCCKGKQKTAGGYIFRYKDTQ